MKTTKRGPKTALPDGTPARILEMSREGVKIKNIARHYGISYQWATELRARAAKEEQQEED